MRLIGYLGLWVVILSVLLFLLFTRQVKLTTSLGVAALVVTSFVSLGLVFLKGYQKFAFIVLLIVLLIGLAVILLRFRVLGCQVCQALPVSR